MKKIKIEMELYIDMQQMKESDVSLEAVRRGLTILPDDVVDGFLITTDIPGCRNTSDFFLKDFKVCQVSIENAPEEAPLPDIPEETDAAHGPSY